jgi:hypothetical protein
MPKYRPKMNFRGLPEPEAARAALRRATEALPDPVLAATLAGTALDSATAYSRAAEILRSLPHALAACWGEVCLTLMELGFRGGPAAWRSPAHLAYEEVCSAALSRLRHLRPAGAAARYAEIWASPHGSSAAFRDALHGIYVPMHRRGSKIHEDDKRGIVGPEELPVVFDWFEAIATTDPRGEHFERGLRRTIGIEGTASTLEELRARLSDPTRKLRRPHRRSYERSVAMLAEKLQRS